MKATRKTVLEYVQTQYSTQGERLWERYPEYVVLRHPCGNLYIHERGIAYACDVVSVSESGGVSQVKASLVREYSPCVPINVAKEHGICSVNGAQSPLRAVLCLGKQILKAAFKQYA